MKKFQLFRGSPNQVIADPGFFHASLNLRSGLLRTFLSFLSGALLNLAFPPINWFVFAFICPSILLFIWLRSSPRAAFVYGFAFGFGFFGIGASWVYISVHNFGNAGIFLAGFITLAFVLLLASYSALCGYLFRRFFAKANMAVSCLLAFPALWVICEWLRGWVFTGFPWLFLGYSQTHFVLKNLAPILSVYGVSLATAFICGVITWCLTKKHNPDLRSGLLGGMLILLILTASYICGRFTWTAPLGKPIPVALVQGNVALEMKWDQNYLTHILDIYTQQTEQHWNQGIIVWPEAAVPIIAQQVQGYLTQMNAAAKKHNTAIILGIPTSTTNGNYYNSLMVLGDGSGIYNKHHLVPYGEYTPLGAILQPLINALGLPMSGFSKGAAHQALLQAKNITLAPFICYEIGYPAQVLSSARNSNALVVVSDDSWFGNSSASAQQYQLAQMRAMETQRPILYATNSGITAIILSDGSTQKTVPINQLSTLVSFFQPVSGETLVMRAHNLIVLGLILLMLLLGFALRRK